MIKDEVLLDISRLGLEKELALFDGIARFDAQDVDLAATWEAHVGLSGARDRPVRLIWLSIEPRRTTTFCGPRTVPLVEVVSVPTRAVTVGDACVNDGSVVGSTVSLPPRRGTIEAAKLGASRKPTTLSGPRRQRRSSSSVCSALTGVLLQVRPS